MNNHAITLINERILHLEEGLRDLNNRTVETASRAAELQRTSERLQQSLIGQKLELAGLYNSKRVLEAK